MSADEPCVDGRAALPPLPTPPSVGFAGPTRSLAQWVGRQLIAICMIPVGVALGVLGIIEDRWRRRTA